MEEKKFDEWNEFKKTLELRNDPPIFSVGDIWFCSIGVNIGRELDGKNYFSERPVIVLAKFGRTYFWAVPLSSGIKEGNYFYSSLFAGEHSTAVLIQMRLVDSRRLQRRIGTVPLAELHVIRERVTALAFKN